MTYHDLFCEPAGAAARNAAASLLKTLASRTRLLVIANLATNGEMNVGALNAKIHVSPAVLSQHLAKLRSQGLVCCRRTQSIVFYRLVPEREDLLRRILSVLLSHLDPTKSD